MEQQATTVALYAREVAPTEPELERLLESDPEVVAVAFPEVFGDHFTELIVNLGNIAESGKRLQVVGPSPFLRMQTLVERDE